MNPENTTQPPQAGRPSGLSGIAGSDIPAPLVKRPLVLTRCPNPRALAATIGTAQALNWLRKNECYFESFTRMTLGWEKDLPASATLVIPECYDVDEVVRYLASPEWVTLI